MLYLRGRYGDINFKVYIYIITLGRIGLICPLYIYIKIFANWSPSLPLSAGAAYRAKNGLHFHIKLITEVIFAQITCPCLRNSLYYIHVRDKAHYYHAH